jgi:predicted RNase H-like HicB family nuclease
MPRDLAYYLSLPYRVTLEQQELSDGLPILFAQHPELPGCCAQGETEAEALASLREARELYLSVLIKRGLPVPEPEAVPAGVG